MHQWDHRVLIAIYGMYTIAIIMLCIDTSNMIYSCARVLRVLLNHHPNLNVLVVGRHLDDDNHRDSQPNESYDASTPEVMIMAPSPLPTPALAITLFFSHPSRSSPL
jgi:hypothetical protein